MEMMQIVVHPDQRPAVWRSLYVVARSNNVQNFVVELNKVQASTGLPLQDIINKVSPGGNSLLHEAARTGSQHITVWLAQQFPHLIALTNYTGDTALHSAAKAGKAETAKVLLQFRTNIPSAKVGEGHPLLRMRNQEGNTALHEAVIHCNYADRESYHVVVTCMVSEDPELAYIENNERKAPLYLAVENTDLEILPHLLECHLPAVAGDRQQQLEGEYSPVHAAILLKKFGELKEMFKRRPELINSKDGNGRNVLHSAATVGNTEAIDFLLQNYPKGIYERDNEGLYPLHVACENGYVKAFDKLFREWPDTSEFLDNKRQNLLHVAAKNGRDYVVRRIVKDPKLAPELVNAKDIEGNTPLHLAAMNGHSLVVGTLLLTRKCDSLILNKRGLTAYEVAKERAGEPMDSGKQLKYNVQSNEQTNEKSNKQCNEQREFSSKNTKRPDAAGSEKYNEQSKERKNEQHDCSSKNTKRPDSIHSMMTLSILFVSYAYQLYCGRCGEHQTKSMRQEVKILKKANMQDIKERLSSLLVVATLIAGIAFQGALQMPGDGNTSSSALASAPAPAPSSWLRNHIIMKIETISLQIYTFFDSLSLNLSIMAAIMLCWVQLVDVNLASFFVWNASILVGGSLYSICVAFGFAVFRGLEKDSAGFADFMIVLEALFILVLTVFTSPLFIPFGLKYMFVRGLYVAVFIGYFIVHRLLDCCLCRLEKT